MHFHNVMSIVPFWEKEPAKAHGIINARAESILEKPAFKKIFEKQRCLVLANSFYEWQAGGRIKQPFRIYLKSEELFAMAGIYERHQDLITFAIITVEPNEILKKIHDRVPAILRFKDEKNWLTKKPAEAIKFLAPYPAREMAVVPISMLVNSPTNEGPEILRPLQKLF